MVGIGEGWLVYGRGGWYRGGVVGVGEGWLV